MNTFHRLSIAVAMLAGFALVPASAAFARDWDSHDRGDRPSHERSAPSRDFRGGSAPPQSHNMPSRDFRGGAGPSSRNMPSRDFRGSPSGFHDNARDFSRNRSEARDFRSRDRGFESRSFTRESRNVSRDFRDRTPRDFSNRSRPSRDFQRPSRDFHGVPRDFRGSRNTQVGSSHQFHGFHGRDFAQFTASDHQSWRHGNWQHCWHHGRFGWWFIVDGFWFIYDLPIYPYPTYVSYYYDDSYYGGGDYYWYWCDDPQGYYPYVQECYGPWRPVPPSYDGYGPGDGYDDYGPDGY